MLVLASAVTAARSLHAQQKAIPVVGYLSPKSPGAGAPDTAAFRQGLEEIGFVEGRNVAIEYRWADDEYDRLPALVADLVARKVSVIFSVSVVATVAAKAATSTIPIVFTVGPDRSHSAS
jgi:putative ABC transport system substrate-binding protein